MIVSGGGVQVESVTIDSPTQATVKVRVFKAAPTGEVNVTLTEPGSPPVSWPCNSCLMVG